MFKRAVNDVINVLTKLNKLSIKEKVYLFLLFVVLYFLVKMVMKQFVVTERFSLGEFFNQNGPTDEQIKVVSEGMGKLEKEAMTNRTTRTLGAPPRMTRASTDASRQNQLAGYSLEKINKDRPFSTVAPPIIRRTPETTEARAERFAAGQARVERFANRTKLMATLDKK